MIAFCQLILAGCLCTTKTLLTSSNPADYVSLTRFDLRLLANWMMTMRRQNPSLKRTSRDNPESEFRPLADQWRKETGALSSVSQITMHPAYQRIIDMRESYPIDSSRIGRTVRSLVSGIACHHRGESGPSGSCWKCTADD